MSGLVRCGLPLSPARRASQMNTAPRSQIYRSIWTRSYARCTL